MVLACVVQPPPPPPPSSDMWHSTLEIAAAQRGFDPLQIRNRAEIIFLMCEQ